MEELYNEYENSLTDNIQTNEANPEIIIYEGEFSIVENDFTATISGIIKYRWFPNKGPYFTGNIKESTTNIINALAKSNIHLVIDSIKVGEIFITNIKGENSITGTFKSDAIKGDKTISVNKIQFSIPNFTDFRGLPTKSENGKTTSYGSNRIQLITEKHTIIIDKSPNFKNSLESLKEKGGYAILLNGEIQTEKSSITYQESNEILHCLNTYLSFINGRRTSAIFAQGIYDNQIIWTDFSNKKIDIYKYSSSWFYDDSINGLTDIWVKFVSLWKNDNDKNFLISVIHWYIEANNNSGYTEGSIIMAQTALELLYNWLIVENKKLIIGSDAANINAANKIRLLISQLKINYDVPSDFINLQKYIDDSKLAMDAPEAITQIRNAIVHSQEDKRKKLIEIEYKAKYEALQLSIWYIEMSLLQILNFNYEYDNRCSKDYDIKKVPWAQP